MRRLTEGSLALEQKQKNVIVVGAEEQPEARKVRVAAYARVSSASDDQLNSFAAQMRYYTALISSKENWTLADVYADEGITGTSAERRPEFQRLLSDCRKGRIDKVLVKSISRFSRNVKDCLEAVRELKSIGVGICFEEQNIDTSNMNGELLTAMFASLAQAESESILTKTLPRKKSEAVFAIQRLAVCGACDARARRYSNQYGRERWRCLGCDSISIEVADSMLEENVSDILTTLYRSPNLIQSPSQTATDIGDKARCLKNELESMLNGSELDEDAAKELTFSLAAAQFSALGSNDYETMRIQRLMTEIELGDAQKFSVLRQTAAAIRIYPDGEVNITLKNGQTLGRSDPT